MPTWRQTAQGFKPDLLPELLPLHNINKEMNYGRAACAYFERHEQQNVDQAIPSSPRYYY